MGVPGGQRFVFFHFDARLEPTGVHAGAENALITLARTLVGRGHEVTVLGRLVQDQTVDGVRYLTAGPAGGYDVEAGLRRVRGTCDVLISTLRADILAASLGDAAIRCRVLWPHVTDPEAIGVPVLRLLEVADRLVAVSHDQAAAFAAAGYPRSRMDVALDGVDGALFAADDGVRVRGRIVFAGALVADKGIDGLLDAMPLVRHAVEAAELHVYGSGSLWGREACIDVDAAARALGYVYFHGAVERSALAAALRAAELAVVPSHPARYREALGMISVEAQACGTPVVVTRNGGLPETVLQGETGWVVDTCSPPALAAALVQALADPVRLRGMGVRAAAWARTQFSWERKAAVFEGLAAPGSTPRIALVTTWEQPCGLSRYAEQLVRELPPGTLRVFAERTSEPSESAPPAVLVDRLWRRGQALEDMRGAAEAGGVELVHVNHHGGLFGRQLSRVLRQLQASDIRSIVTLHAPNQRDGEIAALGEVADRLIVHNEGTRLEVIAHGVPAEKICVIPHGIAAVRDDDATATRAALGLRPNEKLIASVGFIQPHKGFHEVIRALPALRARLPVQYLILGGPHRSDPRSEAYREECHALAERLGVRDAVTIVGEYLPDALLAHYLRAADAIVLPYQSNWWETSAAVREAIASGRPIVTSPALAFADLGSAVLRTTDAFDLAGAIEAVLTQPELARLLVTAATQLSEECAWPRIAARHLELYRDVLSCPTVPAKTPGRLRVGIMLRPDARETGGGDYVVAAALQQALPARGIDILCREGGRVPADTDLVHLVNLCTYAATHAHARRTLALGTPYVVTALYEDWLSFKVPSEALLQQYRQRLGLTPTVDLAAYATLHARELRDLHDLSAFVVEHARSVQASGESEAVRLAHDFPGARVETIPFWVGEPVAPDVDEFVRKFGTRDFVLCVGRLEPRKNQLLLLEALTDVDVDVVFATGGYAYRRDYLEALQAFRRRGRTLYLPKLTPAELAAAYRLARVHVLPSWFELPGLVTLEALRHGCGVVASDRGTLRDYLVDTIPYSAPDDPAALHAAITVASTWDYAPARARAETFTRERCVAAWAELYRSAVSAGGDLERRARRRPGGGGRPQARGTGVAVQQGGSFAAE